MLQHRCDVQQKRLGRLPPVTGSGTVRQPKTTIPEMQVAATGEMGGSLGVGWQLAADVLMLVTSPIYPPQQKNRLAHYGERKWEMMKNLFQTFLYILNGEI